jgi:hypothetical protein
LRRLFLPACEAPLRAPSYAGRSASARPEPGYERGTEAALLRALAQSVIDRSGEPYPFCGDLKPRPFFARIHRPFGLHDAFPSLQAKPGWFVAEHDPRLGASRLFVGSVPDSPPSEASVAPPGRDGHFLATRHTSTNLARAPLILRCPQCWASGVSETRCRKPASARAPTETTPSFPNAIKCFASAGRATVAEIVPTRLGR